MLYSLCNPHPRWLRQEPVLVGSRAIHFWFPDFRRGGDEGADWDWLSAAPVDAPWRMENDDVHEVFVDERINGWHWGDPIATPDELYTLKLSHMFWEVNGSTQNWNKHMYDIIFLQKKGCLFLPELYDLLLPIWKGQHGGRKAKLVGKTKDGFFQDAVTRIYDHDSIHEAVAYRERPAYESILKPGSQVDCSFELFQALSHEEKVILCREEVEVTAYERLILPAWEQGRTVDNRRAYHWALRRTCTSLFQPRWALFIGLNFHEIFIPTPGWVDRFKQNQDKLVRL